GDPPRIPRAPRQRGAEVPARRGLSPRGGHAGAARVVDEHARTGGALMTRAARAAAAALFACALAAGAAPPGAGGPPPLSRVRDVRVEIEIVTGEIELRATSANELRVRAKGPIEVKGSHRRVSVRAASAGWMPWSQPADVDVEIELPRKSRIAARAINGGIKA